MSLQNTKEEVLKLRAACEKHSVKIASHEGKLVRLEEDMEKIEDQVQENKVALVRGEEVIEQLEKATSTMNMTVNTLHDTVLTLDHSMSLFGKFLKFGLFPVVVFLAGEALWSFITR